MPKKGKVNKLARMSDEERARYLQHRADMEEEARRRKYELIDRFIKNKLDKEENYSKINTAKINQGWRFILRKIKCNQMALEIQAMMRSFNFLMDRKNRLLESLMRAINDSNDQHRRAFQAHTENLSYFIKLGSQRLDKLQNEYENQKSNLLASWEMEEQDITDKQDSGEFKLVLIKFIQTTDFEAFKKSKEIERATAKNDARLEHEAEIHDLCKPKKLQIEMYWGSLKDVYDCYLEKHNPIMGHYQTLLDKDNFYQQEIFKNDIHIQQASEILNSLQLEWNKMNTSMEMKLKRMNKRKEELAIRYWQMKRETKLERKRENESLTVLVDASQDAINRLQDVKDKLLKTIHLSKICSKYENKKDFALLTELDENGTPVEFQNLDQAMANECKEFSKMDKFLLKVNRIKVQNMCLKAEKAKLTGENMQLKQYIKRYLTELALTGGQARPHSMRVHSEMEKVQMSKKYLNRPVTCIEGALSNAVLHEKRMKLQEKKDKEIGQVRAYPRVHCW
ncbi:dynein regulatory complex subunit 2-like [Aricia agestis]|uniref:dynein regulatory complex subunit 2-like n=1 Tax=Aricia agestis TaxID=91739 RepID=UPI001C2060DA|nr:dynein regulatory complex subunit 2-like [Aricia agestis]